MVPWQAGAFTNVLNLKGADVFNIPRGVIVYYRLPIQLLAQGTSPGYVPAVH